MHTIYGVLIFVSISLSWQVQQVPQICKSRLVQLVASLTAKINLKFDLSGEL